MHSLYKRPRRWPALLALFLISGGVLWHSLGLVSASFNSGTVALKSAVFAETVATFAANCTTPQTVFPQGRTVCAQVTGIDAPVANARFDFVDPDGIVQEQGPDITTDAQTATFTIPDSGPNAKTGTWRVNITYNSDSSVIASTNFTVSSCPAITLNPASLPNATLNAPYGQAITASTAGSYTFSVTGGSTPPGLTLNANGTWSGAPTTLGSSTFTVSAQDTNGCTGSQSYTLTVVCPTISLSLATLPNATVNTSYNQVFSASPAGSYTFAITSGAAPPGLSLNANGTWSGAPTAAGSFSFTVTAQDANGCTGSQSYTLAVICPVISVSPATLPNANLGSNYNQTLTATPGGASYSFALSGGSLPPGLSLSSDGLITGAPTAAGSFTFTVSATSFGSCVGTRTYTLLVIAICAPITLSPASLPGGTIGIAYNQPLSAAGGTGPYTFAVTAGALPSGLSLSSGGALSGTPIAAGSFSFTLTATGTGGCTGTQSYTLAVICPSTAWSPATLPGAQTGVAYSETVNATNATGYSLLSGSLPAGLNLNAATGVISGIANATGTYHFTLQASGSGGCSATQSYSLVVSCPPITLNPATLPGGTTGTAYSQTFSATPSGNYSFARTSGTLPPGLNLSTTGVLSGTPTAQGMYSFTITATGFGVCMGSQSYTVTITASCVPITLPSIAATGKVGVNYYGNLATTTPSGSYTFSLESGTLPPGLTIDNLFGALLGKPTAAGTYNFTLKATRSNGCTGSRAYTVTVSN